MAVWWFRLSTCFNTLQPTIQCLQGLCGAFCWNQGLLLNANTPKETQREKNGSMMFNVFGMVQSSNYSHQDWCIVWVVSRFDAFLLCSQTVFSKRIPPDTFSCSCRSPAFKPRSVNKLPPKWMCFTPGTTAKGTAEGKHYSLLCTLNTSIFNTSFAPTKPVGTSAAFLSSCDSDQIVPVFEKRNSPDCPMCPACLCHKSPGWTECAFEKRIETYRNQTK